jgi:peptidoglycan/LPS O-acetylase OafA/YrhL
MPVKSTPTPAPVLGEGMTENSSAGKASPAKPDSAKLASLESLRGLLALWVLVAHVAARIISDGTIERAHSQAMLEPLMPVYVFMMLSGFVIFGLMDREREPYGTFVLRRFFRLAPLYLVVLLIVSSLVAFELRTLDNLFWRNSHVYDSIKIHRETIGYFWPHFWAHLFMVHGLLPESLLRDANFTFLSQGWSISLEWQFYLLAPFYFFLLRTRRYTAAALAAAVTAAVGFLHFAGAGFLPNQFIYFAVGMLSYYAYRAPGWFNVTNRRAHDAIMLLTVVIFLLAVREIIPFVIWLVVMDVIMLRKAGIETAISRRLTWILEQPALQWLGRISYSLYLVHMPVLYVVFRAVTRLSPHTGGWKFLAIALPMTVLMSLLIAALTFRWIELPGIALGRMLSRPRKSPA